MVRKKFERSQEKYGTKLAFLGQINWDQDILCTFESGKLSRGEKRL